jgi:hypothetical protein
MAARFSNPFPQFFNSTPQVLSGAKLFFYEAGTSTKLDTYSDAALATPNTNPVVLNSAGYPPTDIFLANQAYKIVLAPSTDADPPTSPIWTADNYYGTDFAAVVHTQVGSGSPNGSVAGTAGSAGVLPTQYWDYANQILYICTATGDAAAAVWTALNASAATPSVPQPQGYLTLVTGVPVITADQSAKTTVFYTPDKGNLIPIYNGASFTPTAFSELSLTLVASHVASTLYDIFVWSESGVLTLGTGPAWSVSTAGSGARGTGASSTELTRINGLLVNAVSMTTRNGSTTYTVGANLATYVGSIFMDGTNGQVTCHRAYGQSRKFGLWNAYNQREIILEAGDSTVSWAYSTATIRASNGASANKATAFQGLQDGPVSATFYQNVNLGNSDTARIGAGVNSTTAFSGFAGTGHSDSSTITDETLNGYHQAILALGINDIQCLEIADASAPTFSGGNTAMIMAVRWMG